MHIDVHGSSAYCTSTVYELRPARTSEPPPPRCLSIQYSPSGARCIQSRRLPYHTDLCTRGTHVLLRVASQRILSGLPLAVLNDSFGDPCSPLTGSYASDRYVLSYDRNDLLSSESSVSSVSRSTFRHPPDPHIFKPFPSPIPSPSSPPPHALSAVLSFFLSLSLFLTFLPPPCFPPAWIPSFPTHQQP